MPQRKRRISNTQIRGSVFGLKEVAFNQAKSSTSMSFVNSTSWSEADLYTYFGGGAGAAAPLPTSGTCSIYRLDLNTETYNTPLSNNLARAYYAMTGVTGDIYGYFMGGANPVVQTIKRVDYLTDTVTTPGTLSLNYAFSAAAQDNNYAYLGGGSTNVPGTGTLTTCSKFDYAIDGMFATPAVIYNTGVSFSGKSKHAAYASSAYGYFIGGQYEITTPTSNTVADTSGVFEIDLKTGTNTHDISAYGSSIDPASGDGAFAIQTNTYGYASGTSSTLNRLNFYDQTQRNLPSFFPVVLNARATGGNNITGYFVGGGPTPNSRIDRMNFSTETLSSGGNFLGGAMQYIGSFSAGGRRVKIKPTTSLGTGFFVGGRIGPGIYSTIIRLSFTTESTYLNPTTLPYTMERSSSATNASSNYSYFVGGQPAFSNFTRLDFNTGNLTITPIKFPSAVYSNAATSSPTNGYFAGGVIPPGTTYSCTITRLSFSTETFSLPGKNLPSVLHEHTDASTPTSGYYIAGDTGANLYICTISRIDFSTETVSLPGKNIPQAKGFIAVVQTPTYAYLTGGVNSTTTVNTISRLEFSTDTVSSPGKNLPRSTGTGGSAGASAQNDGYIGGGFVIGPTAYYSSIEKINFSTEIASRIPGSLPGARGYIDAVSTF